jgi:glycerol kinase
MPEFVGALDQGTTSTRFMVFDHDGREVARHQLEHRQILPQPGWVEHDPVEILERSQAVMAGALERAALSDRDLIAIGIANQRETTVVWDIRTGRPYLNAIVWQDTRTAEIVDGLIAAGAASLLEERTGLPPATYFSGPKLRWALDHVDGLAADVSAGRAVAGTVDSWLIWNLTGGTRGGRHLTDATNASRTMLMDLKGLDWHPDLLSLFGVPLEMLPQIRPSSGELGEVRIGAHPTRPVPLTAALGDQQAAMVGQVCLGPGEAKNTYGTGNFLLMNTGTEVRRSANRLLSTVCYRLGSGPAAYALEAPIAVTGSAVQWLRDQLGIIGSAAEVEQLAAGVDSTEGVYFVPAFSGLFAPYWRADARGAVVGLTRATTREHLARATLEAICYQTRDVVLALERDTGSQLECLKVDGGVTANNLCMQLQADVLGIPVSKPVVAETTALGAAYAAGLATGWWSGPEDLRRHWQEERRWEPTWSDDRRQAGYAAWGRAVERSLDWAPSGP